MGRIELIEVWIVVCLMKDSAKYWILVPSKVAE
jgi:hypothetical protein